jgi:hypothetical protein
MLTSGCDSALGVNKYEPRDVTRLEIAAHRRVRSRGCRGRSGELAYGLFQAAKRLQAASLRRAHLLCRMACKIVGECPAEKPRLQAAVFQKLFACAAKLSLKPVLRPITPH